MKEAVYNTSAYFKYDYEDSPVLGKIPPTGLSGGVKTLILFRLNKDKIFNASTCGGNCAKWLLKIAESEDRTVNLRHLMDFGKEPFTIRILNTNEIVHSYERTGADCRRICLMEEWYDERET